jgi:cytochrome oxidase Cu insertion factor (SCO1/SenC/PrrC family)
MSDPSPTDQTPADTEPRNPAPQPGSTLPYFVALAVLFIAAYGAWKWWQVRQDQLRRSEAIPISAVGPPLSEFELTERSGEPFRSEDMRGRVWVVTYFFTTCPGSCLRLNQNIQHLHNLPELEDVTWVSITCDPATDTLEALSEYADRWEADPDRWLFCRADLEYTKRVALGMNLALYRQNHQDYAIVIGKAGNIRGVFDATSKSQCQRLRTMLLQCVEEPYPQEVAAAGQATTSHQ